MCLDTIELQISHLRCEMIHFKYILQSVFQGLYLTLVSHRHVI